MDKDRAIEYALDGDAILFVGAGFSVGATNLRGQPFKVGRKLAEHLSTAAGLPADLTLEDASEEYAAHFGPDGLIRELRAEFSAQSVGDHHLALASIPWRRIYSTNYDNVIETAATSIGKVINPITPLSDVRSIPAGVLSCVHLNGYVERLDRDTLWSDFKLTDSSYLSAALADSPWMVRFRQDLRVARAVVFVGWSVGDLDIKRVLFESEDLYAKTFFVLHPNTDAATLHRAGRFGTVLAESAEAFSKEVESTRRTYRPSDARDLIGFSVVEGVTPRDVIEPKDSQIFDLLLRGDVDAGLVWNSLHGGGRYFLNRAWSARVLDAFAPGRAVAVIHSNLGNGKTLLLEGMKAQALARGLSVYSLVGRSDSTLEEVESLLKRMGQGILFIDDYPEWMDVVRLVGLQGQTEMYLVLTARSSLNDVFVDDVLDWFSFTSVREYSVDQLEEPDLDWLVQFFDEYGLWGKRAGLGQDAKRKHLSVDCRTQWHAVLLSVLESPAILSRIGTMMEDLRAERPYYDIVIGTLILSMLHYPTSMDTLADIFGERVFEAQFRQSAAVSQVVDAERGRITVRSAIAARFILGRLVDGRLIVDILANMARAAQRMASVSPIYSRLLMTVMRFSEIQDILPERGRRAAVISY